MKKHLPAQDRYARYKSIIDVVTQCPTFAVDQVHTACAPEQPAFVSRVINDLERQGWIVREGDGSQNCYRWNAGRGHFDSARWLDSKLFGVQITASPSHQRPRECLLAQGAAALTNAQLLAILIRSGRPGESAVMAGEKLSRHFDGRLSELVAAGRGELKSLSVAVEKTAYCQIMAGIELGRRVAATDRDQAIHRIKSTTDARSYCEQHFERLIHDGHQEEFHIVTLGTRNQVLNSHRITVGTLDASLVHPREVFRPAIGDAASVILLVHNHPSGDPTPSREDVAVTRRLESAGELIGIQVLDHIVVARSGTVSVRDIQ